MKIAPLIYVQLQYAIQFQETHGKICHFITQVFICWTIFVFSFFMNIGYYHTEWSNYGIILQGGMF